MLKIVSELENINFFIIDDIQSIRTQLISDLKSIGCKGEYIEADSIAMAKEIFIQNHTKIQFIICDWNLPDGTGLDFLKKIRSNNIFSKIPFMICTTNDEVSHFLQAIQDGANNFIVKPWLKDDLIKKLNTCWRFVNKA